MGLGAVALSPLGFVRAGSGTSKGHASMRFDRTKSLAELGGEIGWDGTFAGERDVRYDRPLGELTPEDLCELIGEDVALEYLVPLALEMLALDPLLECRQQPRYLLGRVLHCGGRPP